MEEELQNKIIALLNDNKTEDKTMNVCDIKKHLFPSGKISNPPDVREKVQKAILDLMRSNKIDIIDSNLKPHLYVTSSEIEKFKKSNNIPIFHGKGIDEISTQDFFDPRYHFYVRLKENYKYKDK